MTVPVIGQLATRDTAQRRPRSAKVRTAEGLLSLCSVLCSLFCKQNSKHVLAAELLPSSFAGLIIPCLQSHVYLTRTGMGGLVPLAKTLW